MKKYLLDTYQIEIYEDSTFIQDQPVNKHPYDFVYLNASEYQYTSVYGVKLYSGDQLLKSAIIGSDNGETVIHKTSVIVEKNRLLVCCSDTVFCLSIPDLDLLWRTKADDITCFEIYGYQDSYIIHGECEISRLDNDGNILWQQGGDDIFITLDGMDDLVITDNHIMATDWNNKKYKFDFNGRIIR
jgi:outer membrane protein assembly factor BamB